MMRTTSKLVKAVAVFSALIPFCCSALAQDTTGTIVYDNSTTDLNNRGYGLNAVEFGDEITLAPGARTVNRFQFEYFLNQIGSGTAVVNFYKNDGPIVTRTLPDNTTIQVSSPGTLLYTSPVLTLGQGFQAADISNISVDVPDSFTWTVTFNVGATDTANLRLYDPPTVGSSFADFWQKSGGAWNTYLFDGGATPANFGARVTAVPEPTTYAYALLAGLSWLGYISVRRRSS